MPPVTCVYDVHYVGSVQYVSCAEVGIHVLYAWYIVVTGLVMAGCSWRRSCALDRLSAGIGLRSCDASIGRAPQRRGSSTGLALSHSCHRDDRGMPS